MVESSSTLLIAQRKVSVNEICSSHGKLASGSNASLSLVVDTSIMHCATMKEKGTWSLTGKQFWLMDTILRQEWYINITDASGMDVLALLGLLMTSIVKL